MLPPLGHARPSLVLPASGESLNPVPPEPEFPPFELEAEEDGADEEEEEDCDDDGEEVGEDVSEVKGPTQAEPEVADSDEDDEEVDTAALRLWSGAFAELASAPK